ncbi:MAG: peptidylprolyl isomerase [Chloroflexi bacterium]|nr:peptidylprolyl isomerase [Chloroflexota bacterium]MBM3173412.1 peptidylprolyl isomerase [Chloroflexota bacterium]MBM3174581.1 peptidylprolyl isomerase [Chloroflexota bacterium]MBM4449341.1 peptidylprolyl isomerase [Chloroflexota bacterium]
MKYRYLVLVATILLGLILLTGCTAGQGAKNGDTVQVHYTGKLADGTAFDSSLGLEPLEFTLGAGQMIPGFEKAVRGMEVGEKKTVTIPAKDAYGIRNDNWVEEVPIEALPSGFEPEVGSQLQKIFSSGQARIYTVTKVTETTVILDANHHLAGKDLTFEIELVAIK